MSGRGRSPIKTALGRVDRPAIQAGASDHPGGHSDPGPPRIFHNKRTTKVDTLRGHLDRRPQPGDPRLAGRPGSRCSHGAGAQRKEWDPAAVRLALLAHHYRRDWDWQTGEDMPAAAARLALWRSAPEGEGAAGLSAVRAALDDDLDTPGAPSTRRRPPAGRWWPVRGCWASTCSGAPLVALRGGLTQTASGDELPLDSNGFG